MRLPRAQQGQRQTDDDEGGDRPQLVEAAVAERADDPEAVVVEVSRQGERHGLDVGVEHGRDDRAGEDEAHHARAAVAGGADRVDDEGGDAAAEQGHPGGRDRPGRDAEPDARRHHRRGRTCVDAEQAGVGERVDGHALHEGAGDGEGRADDDREDRALDPRVEDIGQVGVGAPREGVDDLGEGGRLGADG
nr:hypothetical protein [Janibacter hoylei]